jgi:hypothetical protein
MGKTIRGGDADREAPIKKALGSAISGAPRCRLPRPFPPLAEYDPALVQSLAVQASDFVLHKQFLTLQLGQFERIGSRMGQGFFELLLQHLVTALEFSQMRFHSHQ